MTEQPYGLGEWVRVYATALRDDHDTVIGRVVGYGHDADGRETIKLKNALGGIERQVEYIVGRYTIVLVSCVSQKRAVPSPARDLYTSTWFRKARRYADMSADRWFILSAKHGLLEPDRVVAPYEATLNAMDQPSRQQWAGGVLQALERHAQVPGCLFVILAGTRYREYLVPLLQQCGAKVEVPMEGLGIGRQVAWLKAQTEPRVVQLELA